MILFLKIWLTIGIALSLWMAYDVLFGKAKSRGMRVIDIPALTIIMIIIWPFAIIFIIFNIRRTIKAFEKRLKEKELDPRQVSKI